MPEPLKGTEPVHHLMPVCAPDADKLMARLQQARVAFGRHYPIPVHLQEAYRSLGHGRGSFPVAELCAVQFLSLPMYPELTREQIVVVTRELKTLLGKTVSSDAIAV